MKKSRILSVLSLLSIVSLASCGTASVSSTTSDESATLSTALKNIRKGFDISASINLDKTYYEDDSYETVTGDTGSETYQAKMTYIHNDKEAFERSVQQMDSDGAYQSLYDDKVYRGSDNYVYYYYLNTDNIVSTDKVTNYYGSNVS